MGKQAMLSTVDLKAHHAVGIQLQTEGDNANIYSEIVQNQRIALIPSFKLESGATLQSVPVAYSTWGTLNENGDNVLVLCHALTGSSDALDWWRPLMGVGRALDFSRYFIFCGNVLGSPYGSASPLSTNPVTGLQYGPDFPDTTVRDDCNIHKLVLDALGVQSIAAVIGGSMGGMTTLEWPLCSPSGYVKNIIPIATSAYHGAWGISWGETQRQAIYSDATFRDGWYEPTPEGQPQKGLGTARMIAMLTYRSHGSFESRFSRRPAARTIKSKKHVPLPVQPQSHRNSVSSEPEAAFDVPSPTTFSAQSYMQYQAEKFLTRFDANCYIHLTKKMDTHDITRDRLEHPLDEQSHPPTKSQLCTVLNNVPPNAVVVSVGTDMLFTPGQQHEIASSLPDARLVKLDSPDGHDGFLLEFENLNGIILQQLRKQLPGMYKDGTALTNVDLGQEARGMNSVFGEAETTDF